VYRLFDPDSREVLFRRDVQFDERFPQMDSPSPASPSLPTPPTSSLEDSLSLEDDVHDAPPSSPPPDTQPFPKWARFTIEPIGSLVGDPLDSHHTRAQTSGASLLSHAILDDS